MSECSIDKKDCNCSSGTCNLLDWIIVYELAMITVVLLLMYAELEKKPTGGESTTKTETNQPKISLGPVRLRGILANLLENAVKFTHWVNWVLWTREVSYEYFNCGR